MIRQPTWLLYFMVKVRQALSPALDDLYKLALEQAGAWDDDNLEPSLCFRILFRIYVGPANRLIRQSEVQVSLNP